MLRIETLDGVAVANSWEQVRAPLAHLYSSTFNREWNESWTADSAADRLQSTLRQGPGRHPVLTLLWEGDKLAGFATGSVISSPEALDDGDFPAYYDLPREQIAEGRRALATQMTTPFFLGNGWVILPEHRQLPVIVECVVSFLERGLELGCETGGGWTSRATPSFYLYASGGCHVVYDFGDPAQLCLFMGSIRRVLLCSEIMHLPGLRGPMMKGVIFATLARKGLLRSQRRHRVTGLARSDSVLETSP